MISQRCRHQGRGSVFNRCFTSSIDTCAAAWVTLAIPFLLLLCQDLLLILPQIADWYEGLRFSFFRLFGVNSFDHLPSFRWWDRFHSVYACGFLPLVVLRHSSHRKKPCRF